MNHKKSTGGQYAVSSTGDRVLHKYIESRALKAIAFVLAVATLTPDAHAQPSLTVASYGGKYSEILFRDIWRSAGKAIGVEVKEAVVTDLASLRVQVKADSVQWDIVELVVPWCVQGATEDMFTALDRKIVDVGDFLPGTYADTWVAGTFYAFVLGWNTDKFGQHGPKTWADFWNVKKFPGTRGLPDRPLQSIEAALMADGISPDKVYPIDLDRAFRKLREIRPYITIFWKNGAHIAQLIKDGELDVTASFNGRSEEAIAAGAHHAFTFNQGLLIPTCFTIPKAGKNRDIAMKLLGEAIKAPYEAAFIRDYSSYGMANQKAYTLGIIPDDVMKNLPTAPRNAALMGLQDGEWWAKHGEEAEERWSNFKAGQ
jgi:putative spermidine/putrescine transport system substrate-binding protein